MKRILFTAAVILSSVICSNAQAPQFRFENWAPTPSPTTSEDPIGFASFNALTFAGMQRTVFRETAAPYEGSISAKIVTEVIPASVMIPNPFNPAEDLDTVGILSVGSIAFGFPPTVTYGKPYVWRPSMLSFACKYTPMPGDSAFVVALLTRWNGSSRDTIAQGWYSTGATSTAFAVNNISMMYDPSFSAFMPDTQQVFISSSVFLHDGAKRGSTFYIDDIAWSGYVGVYEANGVSNNVSIYPNPSATEVNLVCNVEARSVEVMDITGRMIGVYDMQYNKVSIQTTEYVPGIYMFNMYNKEKQVIHRGKFEVTK